jgi:hypothetical protein
MLSPRSLSIPDLLRWVAAVSPGGAVPAARVSFSLFIAA